MAPAAQSADDPGFRGNHAGRSLRGTWSGALFGAAALAAVYLLVHLLAPAAMGAGDVKLALGMGALTGSSGADVWLLAAIGAPLLTAMIGTVGRIFWSAKTVPHGPSMCVASVAAMGLAVF